MFILILAPNVTMKKRSAIWDNIGAHLNSRGANIPDSKWLREREWDYIKRQTSSKIQKNGCTGAEPQAYTELDEAVIDILGRDSANVNGINIPDMEISFGRPSFSGDPRPSNSSRSNTLPLTSQQDSTPPSLGKNIGGVDFVQWDPNSRQSNHPWSGREGGEV